MLKKKNKISIYSYFKIQPVLSKLTRKNGNNKKICRFYFERMDTYVRVWESVHELNFYIVGCKFCVRLLIVSFVINFVQDSLIMFRRNRLPDSLRWRAVGWMEMRLSQADAARGLNVSRQTIVESISNHWFSV